MKLNKEDFEAVIWDDGIPEGWSIVDNGDWISEGKYEYKRIIFSDGEKFYQANIDRSGSYFTEWTYSTEHEDGPFDCAEVEKVEVVKHEWQAV